MKDVLFLNPYYYPGFRSGGPQQTLTNIVDAFGGEENIYILTQNKDLGEEEPYDGIPVGEWLNVGTAHVKYLPRKEYLSRGIKEAYQQFDTVFTCGLFEKNTVVVLLVHRLSGRSGKKLYVAPMGVFSEAALAGKTVKKHAFLYIYKFLGMFKNITWSFTSELEKQDAQRVLGERTVHNYIIAEDIPKKVDVHETQKYLDAYKKEKNKLKIIFLSRISPKKNLSLCLEILNYAFEGQIDFDIYGTLQHKDYWSKCEELMKSLPDNVLARYCGPVRPEDVVRTFSKYDVFLFPTKGENYGHVIYEAAAAGCVPIISDQTPWTGLERIGAGGVYPLDDIDDFRREIQRIIRLDGDAFKACRNNALEFAKEKYAAAVDHSGYVQVFGRL